MVPYPAGDPGVDKGCADPHLNTQAKNTQEVEPATRDKKELHGAPGDDEEAEPDSAARGGE